MLAGFETVTTSQAAKRDRAPATGLPEAGGENLARLKSALRRDALAMAALRDLGIAASSVERLHLGLKQPYRPRSEGVEIRNVLCFPLLGEGMRAVGRYAYRNLPGVTENAPAPCGWGPGSPVVYKLGSFATDATALVVPDVVDCWRMWQCARGELAGMAFLSRSHPAGWPAEWTDPFFWERFERVLLVPGAGSADFLEEMAPRLGRSLEVLRVPAPFADLAEFCQAPNQPLVDDLLATAQPWSVPVPRAVAAIPEGAIGRFQAAPVRITGAFTGGFSYYPFVVETREVEQLRGGVGRIVQSYATMVVRSDGSLLTADALPAPRGTPTERRVLALNDGTRLLEEPVAARQGTWSFKGIEDFVAWRDGRAPRPFRDLADLIADVEEYLASRVWLPGKDQHLIAALYVVLSFVFQVFDAIPLMLVHGERGTGKSELAEAMALISFNAVVATQLRAAGMIRLLDESRGLLVLDDMDGEGQASLVGTGDLAQAIKTSYKASTARKPVADRGGKVRTVDFYGPKIITNTRGVDDVLGSRMVCITTSERPGQDLDRRFDPTSWTEAHINAVRDELHAWAMASGAELRSVWERLPGFRTDRQREILGPLRAIARLSDDYGVVDRLEALVPGCLATAPAA